MIHRHDPQEEAKPLTERPVLFDNCDECTARANHPLDALLRMDNEHMVGIWNRMYAVEFGLDPGGYGDRYLSSNEAMVGRVLYQIALLQQRCPFLKAPPGREERANPVQV